MPKPDDDDVMRSHMPPDGPYEPPRGNLTPGPPPFVFEQLSPEQQAMADARNRSRARVMALLLGAFVILIFGIAFVKIKAGTMH